MTVSVEFPAKHHASDSVNFDLNSGQQILYFDKVRLMSSTRRVVRESFRPDDEKNSTSEYLIVFTLLWAALSFFPIIDWMLRAFGDVPTPATGQYSTPKFKFAVLASVFGFLPPDHVIFAALIVL